MSRYKVGDVVRVRQWDDMVNEYGVDEDGAILKNQNYPISCYFSKDMKRFCGKIFKITCVVESGEYFLDDSELCYFQDWMFEEGIVEMTADDLKEGMVVELRSKELSLIWDNLLYNRDGDAFASIAAFDMKMEYTGRDCKQLDIIAVYTAHDCTSPRDFFDKDHLTLIWKRKPEPKEMTVEEISKALGYEVKVVKG